MPNASHKTDSRGLCHLLEALPVEQGLQSSFLPSPFPTLAQADKWNPPTHLLQTAESHALNSQRWCPGSPAGVKFSPLTDGKQFAPGEKKIYMTRWCYQIGWVRQLPARTHLTFTSVWQQSISERSLFTQRPDRFLFQEWKKILMPAALSLFTETSGLLFQKDWDPRKVPA